MGQVSRRSNRSLQLAGRRLLVTGGLQRKNASVLGEGKRFQAARLLSVETGTEAVDCLIDYPGNRYHYPSETPNVLFSCASLAGDRLYLSSETEIFIYRYPGLELLAQCSLPFFQNIHHVCPLAGGLAVVSSGLDLVVMLDHDTLEPTAFYNVLGKDPWHRFDPDTDYRLVHSTKPHESHPNFVFELDGAPWVTRLNQRDAVCLDDMSRRIELGDVPVHDGHVIDGKVYFTSVDGRIIVADTTSLEVERVIDLRKIEGVEAPLGWCRGLSVVAGVALVGFSRLRRTAIRENVKWLLGNMGLQGDKPTRISAYDLASETKIGDILIPAHLSNVIYSVIAVDQPAG